MISRRNFIQLGAIGLVGASSIATAGKAFAANQLFPLPAGVSADPISRLTSKDFEPLVNTIFRIQNSDLLPGTADLRLIQVKKLAHPVNTARGFRGESYSLLFEKSRRQQRFGQGEYNFSHAKLANFSVFVIPVTPDPNHYEVVVNQISR